MLPESPPEAAEPERAPNPAIPPPALESVTASESGAEALIRAGREIFGTAPVRVGRCNVWQLDTPTRHQVVMTSFFSHQGLGLYRHALSGHGFELIARVEGDASASWLLERLEKVTGDWSIADGDASLTLWDGVSAHPEPQLQTLDTENGLVHFKWIKPDGEDWFTAAPSASHGGRQEALVLSLLARAKEQAIHCISFMPASDEDASNDDEHLTVNSHVGGDALVPVHFSWPVRKGMPLPLLMELDLSELPTKGALPSAGRLLLFGPPNDADDQFVPEKGESWNDVFCVRYLTEPGSPQSDGIRREPQPLRFHAFAHYPSAERLRAPDLLPRDEDEREDVLVQYSDAYPQKRFAHRLLGHAHSIQDDVFVEALIERYGLKYPVPQARYAELQRESSKWMLVMQLESANGWDFCGGGCLYIVAPRDAAARGDFSDARAIVQR